LIPHSDFFLVLGECIGAQFPAFVGYTFVAFYLVVLEDQICNILVSNFADVVLAAVVVGDGGLVVVVVVLVDLVRAGVVSLLTMLLLLLSLKTLLLLLVMWAWLMTLWALSLRRVVVLEELVGHLHFVGSSLHSGMSL
jgi:hypothetical protein